MTEKQRFLENEFLTSALLGALNTRRYRIYTKIPVSETEKERFRKSVREALKKYAEQYSQTISSERHYLNIKAFAKEITTKHKSILAKNCFRIGIAQKLLNLYLKFLWVSDIIKNPPPHCPIDSRIISNLGINNIRWTLIDDIEVYRGVINKAKEKAGSKSLAEWELELWNKTNLNNK